MSGASNLGWGKHSPTSNVNGDFVNKYSENNPAFFTSNVIPGSCFFKGGAKKIKNKIKNITKSYRMTKSKKKSLKRKIKNLHSKKRSGTISSGRRHRRKHKISHKHRQKGGGHAQYQNNQPFSNSFALGGYLSPYDSALANPTPIKYGGTTNNAVDNLNMYDRTGFPSRGHH
jgi:hypothetical protein